MSHSEREQVIRSIKELGCRVTVADVAAHSGLPIEAARMLLNSVAVTSGGCLVVTATGEIAYRFDNLAKLDYRFAGAFARARQYIWNSLTHLAKLLVGVGLALSLAFIFAIVCLVIPGVVAQMFTGSQYAQRERESAEKRSLRARLSTLTSTLEKFFLDCHQFVLGPGSPNKNIQERRWQLIADAIRAHKGVLAVEQIGPYSLGKFHCKNEDAMLPVLLRFEGIPEVSKHGNIIYTFPKLEATTAGHHAQHLERYLKEQTWRYFGLPPERFYPVLLMVCLNFLALHFVGFYMVTPVLCLVWKLALVYSVGLLLFPILRCLGTAYLNVIIEWRNRRRRDYLKQLEHPSKELFTKLVELKDFALTERNLNHEAVVYSTDKDLLQQEIEQPA